MEECGASVYSDLLYYYGVDLRDMVAPEPTLSPRRVLALVENLPMESTTSCILRGVKDGVGWSNNTYLLAAIHDSVMENTFTNVQVRTKKRLTPPERLPVPGVEREKKKKNSFVAAAQKFFAKHQGG